MMLLLPLGILAFVGAIAAGSYVFKRIALLRRGENATVTIVRLEPHGFQLHQVYPVVRFQTMEGKWLTLKAKISSLALDFKPGQQVQVRYLAAAPVDFIVVSGINLLV